MGYWAGKDHRRYYIDGGNVFSRPGGEVLDLDPETLEPRVVSETLSTSTPAPVFETSAEVAPLVVPEPKTVTGRIIHAKKCKSQGRGGRYTDGCPKCEELKAK